MLTAGREIKEQVHNIIKRLEKEVWSLLECRHQLQADQCDECRGMTISGLPMNVVLEVLRQEGLVEVEIAGGKRPSARQTRYLKTILGVGIGATFFLGLVGWQGGKLVWRLIAKKNAKSS